MKTHKPQHSGPYKILFLMLALLAFVDCRQNAEPAGPFVDIQLHGTVTSSVDGQPIPGVAIKLSSSSPQISRGGGGCSGPTTMPTDASSTTGTAYSTTISDDSGSYSITRTLPEQTGLHVSAILNGYQYATRRVNCASGVQTIDFQLEPLPAK